MGSMENGNTEKSRSKNKPIHGFRGFAILLVLLCHLNIPGFRNGFLGVDIFFVISGFLITHYLSLEYISNRKASGRQGWISFIGFYARRARRILPTAYFVILATIAIGSLLTTYSNPKLNSDAGWALFFLSNLNYINQSIEYFGPSVQQSLFLHYWSLSVEEQFYILWPTIFLTLTTIRGFKILNVAFNWRLRLRFGMIIIFTFSFSIYIFQLISNSPSSYFSSLGRFWEFAVGAFFATATKDQFFKNIEKIQFFLITISILAFIGLEERTFRYVVLFPVILTGILLRQFLRGDTSTLYSRLLSSKILLSLGTVSFSLYLVHWPVIVFLEYSGINVGIKTIFWILPLILLLTIMVFREIESRFLKMKIPQVSKKSAARRTRYFPLNLDALKYSTAGLVIVIVMLNIQFGSNQPFIISKIQPKVVEPWAQPNLTKPVADNTDSATLASKQVQEDFLNLWKKKIFEGTKLEKLPAGLLAKLKNLGSDRTSHWEGCLNTLTDKSECNVGNIQARKKVYIFGDSYAYGVLPMVAGALNAKDYYIIVRTKAQCIVPKVETILRGQIDTSCSQFREKVNEEISKVKPFLVIVSSVNSSDINGNLETLYSGMLSEYKFLVANSENLLVIGETPFIANPNICIQPEQVFLKCNGDSRGREEFRRLTLNAAESSGAKYLDITPWLCIYGKCPVIIDGAFTTWDGGHITAELSMKLSPLFKDFFKESIS